MKHFKKFLGGVIVVVSLVILFFIVSFYEGYIASKNKISREVVTTENFSQVWMQPVGLLRAAGRPYLEIEKECVLLADRPSILKCLALDTGAVNWQNELRFNYIATANNKIILAKTHGSRNCSKPFNPHCESIKVTSVDINSGEEIWSNIYTGMLFISEMNANDFKINIGGGGGHGYYGSRMSIDTLSGDRLDYQELEYPVFVPPEPPLPDFVVEKGEVTSNVALANGIYYFFTDNTILWALDENTQRILGTVEFSFDESYEIAQIAAQDDIVLIYFDNSQQLFSLQLLQ